MSTGVVSRDRYRVLGTTGHTPEETETSLSFGYHGKYGDPQNLSAKSDQVGPLAWPQCHTELAFNLSYPSHHAPKTQHDTEMLSKNPKSESQI